MSPTNSCFLLVLLKQSNETASVHSRLECPGSQKEKSLLFLVRNVKCKVLVLKYEIFMFAVFSLSVARLLHLISNKG